MNTTTTTTTMSMLQGDASLSTQRSISPNIAVRQSTDKERFPSFDFSAQPTSGIPISESPSEAKPVEYRWPSRRGSQRVPLRQGNQPTHRAKRSVSDALAKFRNRQGSVSENASELAEALKAPISYRLIVGLPKVTMYTADSERFFVSFGT